MSWTRRRARRLWSLNAGRRQRASARGSDEQGQALSQERFDLETRLAGAHSLEGGRGVAPPKTELTERGEHHGMSVRRRLRGARVSSSRLLSPFELAAAGWLCCPGLDLVLDVPFTKYRACAVGIVASAEQTKIVERRETAKRKRLPVLERHEAPLAAAPPFGVHIGALAAVALPHGPRDLDRHVPRALLELSLLARPPRAEAPAGLLFDQRIQSALEELAEVTARQHVAQKLARSFDLVAKLGAGRKLHAVA